jgi:hypothetical protein
MNRSTFNHGKSGDTNPKGRSRSPLLKLYPRLLRSEREEIIGHRASAACGGRPRLCYTLDEGKETERETTNCPPKRVRSTAPHFRIPRRPDSSIDSDMYIRALREVYGPKWGWSADRIDQAERDLLAKIRSGVFEVETEANEATWSNRLRNEFPICSMSSA